MNISKLMHQLSMHRFVLQGCICSEFSGMLLPLLFESFFFFILDPMEFFFKLWFLSSNLPLGDLMYYSINGFFLANLLLSCTVIFVHFLLLNDGMTVGSLSEHLIGVEVFGVEFAVWSCSLRTEDHVALLVAAWRCNEVAMAWGMDESLAKSHIHLSVAER